MAVNSIRRNIQRRATNTGIPPEVGVVGTTSRLRERVNVNARCLISPYGNDPTSSRHRDDDGRQCIQACNNVSGGGGPGP